MDCPKCGHKQDDAVRCQSCGIYFDKYRRQQAITPASTEDGSSASNSGRTLKIALVALLITALGVVFYTRFSSSAKKPAPVVAQKQSAAPQPIQPLPEKSDVPAAKQIDEPVGLAAQIAQSNPPGNTIEAARNATVFIKTSWGTLGSGFLVDGDCHGITNRHVLEFNADKLIRNVQEDPEFRARLSAAQDRLRMEIENLRSQRDQILAYRHGSVIDAQQLSNKIRELEERLATLPQDVEAKMRSELDRTVTDKKSYTVVMIDGTEFPMSQVDFADDNDLAMFQLPAV